MPTTSITIHIISQAPAKPKVGAPCNGCGVCCLLEPCPLGVLLSGFREGACRALQWQADSLQYRCGAITQPQAELTKRLPWVLRPLVPGLAWLLRRWAKRWVAAGIGCDCDVQVVYSEAAEDRTFIIGP